VADLEGVCLDSEVGAILVKNVFFTVFEIVTAHFWAFFAGENRKFFLRGGGDRPPPPKSATAVIIAFHITLSRRKRHTSVVLTYQGITSCILANSLASYLSVFSSQLIHLI
jgi:hypothetical protein